MRNKKKLCAGILMLLLLTGCSSQEVLQEVPQTIVLPESQIDTMPVQETAAAENDNTESFSLLEEGGSRFAYESLDVIGLLTEQLAVVAVFTLSFMVLRSYTGGYHSDSRIFCYLGSNLVLLVPVYTQAVFYKTSLARLLAVLLVSAGIIYLLSPMHSKNRKLDKEEQKHFGRKARLIAVLELAVLGILWHAGQIPYAYAVYTGICITALFMIVGKAQLWIQSHTENG